jgi:hypothetical protein
VRDAQPPAHRADHSGDVVAVGVGLAVMREEVVADLLPALLLPPVQRGQTWGREEDQAVLEALAAVDVELPHALDLDDVRRLERREFRDPDAGVQ